MPINLEGAIPILGGIFVGWQPPAVTILPKTPQKVKPGGANGGQNSRFWLQLSSYSVYFNFLVFLIRPSPGLPQQMRDSRSVRGTSLERSTLHRTRD